MSSIAPTEPVFPPLAPPLAPPTPEERAAGNALPEAEPELGMKRIPTEVSAAWELELLIAGAVTFALFQLPGSIDSLRESLMPKLAGGWVAALIFGYLYTKVIVYTLLGAFLLNLTLRAYWVGLVGLHSVFPNGVKWETMQARVGPATMEEYRKRHSSIPSIIERVDNFASVIFSFAFLIVLTCVFSLVACALFGGVSWGISQLLFDGKHTLVVFEVLAFGMAAPLSAIGIIDKKFGRRWAPESVAGQRLRKAARLAMRMNGSSLFGPIIFTLYTNVRKGLTMTAFYVAFLGALLVVMVEFFVRIGVFSSGAPRYFPEDEALRGMSALHYESLQPPDERREPTITIQSDVITDPYVKLFIPYDQERHDAALAASCPAAAPMRPSGLHVRATIAADKRAGAERDAATVLGCLARLHAITIDGVPQNVDLRFYVHPEAGQRGLVAYLPVANLAAGPHTLGVMPPPRAPTSTSKRPVVRLEIPFFK